MRKLPIAAVLAVVAFAAWAAPTWDGTYTRKAHVVLDGGQQLAMLTASSPVTPTYAKVTCGHDTWIGTARTDGGASSIGTQACFLTDGGNGCDLYKFTLGEKFYCLLAPNLNSLVIWSDGGTDSCEVFEGR